MSTTPFLGCKISLISKSEIRYEGILYTIDPKESTIALAKVKSFGTEDRNAERAVPPRDEIYEYIIFRAGDIKDLIVDDPPSSIVPGLADPAIIQAHSTTNTGSNFPQSVSSFPQLQTQSTASTNGTSQGQRTNTNVTPFQSGFTTAPTHVSGVPVHYNTTTNSVDSRSGNSTPTGGGGGHRSKSPRHETSRIMSGRQSPKDNRGQKDHRNINQQRRGGSGGGGYQQQQRRGGGGQYQYQNYQNRQNYQQSYGAQQSRGVNRQGQGNWVQRGQNRGPLVSRPPNQQRLSQSRGPQNQRVKETLKFDAEFDFEKSNKEFEELDKKVSNLKIDDSKDENEKKDIDTTNGETPENKPQGEENHDHDFYDKTKSFFDSISCEASERSKGNVQRVDWKAERKLNVETFGLSLNNWRRQGPGYGRGRTYSGGPNRSGQYRAGYQSRGGYGGYSGTRYSHPSRGNTDIGGGDKKFTVPRPKN